MQKKTATYLDSQKQKEAVGPDLLSIVEDTGSPCVAFDDFVYLSSLTHGSTNPYFCGQTKDPGTTKRRVLGVFAGPGYS